jgi:hypothetical protein
MDGHRPETYPLRSRWEMGKLRVQNSAYRFACPCDLVLSRWDKSFCQIVFLPKDMDEIEALTKGLFKARTRVTMMP